MLAFGLKEIKAARKATRSSIFGLRPQKIKAARKIINVRVSREIKSNFPFPSYLWGNFRPVRHRARLALKEVSMRTAGLDMCLPACWLGVLV